MMVCTELNYQPELKITKVHLFVWLKRVEWIEFVARYSENKSIGVVGFWRRNVYSLWRVSWNLLICRMVAADKKLLLDSQTRGQMWWKTRALIWSVGTKSSNNWERTKTVSCFACLTGMHKLLYPRPCKQEFYMYAIMQSHQDTQRAHGFIIFFAVLFAGHPCLSAATPLWITV